MNSLLKIFFEARETSSVSKKNSSNITAASADFIVNLLTEWLEVEEIRRKRGQNFQQSNAYQIRIKPKSAGTSQDLLKSVHAFLKENASKFDFKNIKVNSLSPNSGRFSSVLFDFNGITFDVVVAAGKNEGELFEKTLLIKIDNYISGIDDSEEAKAALIAIKLADPTFKIEKIDSVVPRTGKTYRKKISDPNEIGKVIADIIMKMKDGSEKYISVKNKRGKTVAQFGISNAFNDDLTVNKRSNDWKEWLEPFGLDAKKIENGLKVAQLKSGNNPSDTVILNKTLSQSDRIFKVLEKMWGANYIYLRETGNGSFKAFKIDKDFVRNVLLKNIKITKINYPSLNRSQINIYLENKFISYKIEIRNPRGGGSIKPTQIQLSILNFDID